MTTLLLAACAAPTERPVEVTDWFQQVPDDEVDVLWVVSDAGDMGAQREALVAGFPGFVDDLRDSLADAHLGVISTSFAFDDPGRGVLIGDPPWMDLSEDLSAFPDRFLARTPPTPEHGIDALELALEPTMLNGGPNDGFRREDAALRVIVVSTRDDEGSEPVEDALRGLRDPDHPDRASLDAVVGSPYSPCATAGGRYAELAEASGGEVGEVCDLPADPSLAFPTFAFTEQDLVSSFQLTQEPVPSTVRVQDEEGHSVPEDPTDGWTLVRAAPTAEIELHGEAVPPRGEELEVRYQVR